MSLLRLMIICCRKGICYLGRAVSFLENLVEYPPDDSSRFYDCCPECVIEFYSFDSLLDDIARRVDYLMDEKKLFLKEDLTLDKLAREVGTNRTYLSKMFNRILFQLS